MLPDFEFPDSLFQAQQTVMMPCQKKTDGKHFLEDRNRIVWSASKNLLQKISIDFDLLPMIREKMKLKM